MEVIWGAHSYRVPIACEPFSKECDPSFLIYHDPDLNLTFSDAFGHTNFLKWLLLHSTTSGGSAPESAKFLIKDCMPIRVNQSDQTNTCVFYGQKYFLKFYRKIELGQNRECTTLRALQHYETQDERRTWPDLVTAVQDPSRSEESTAWSVQKLIPNAINVWEYLGTKLSAVQEKHPQMPPNEIEDKPEWIDLLQVIEKIGPSLAKLHQTLARMSPSISISQPMDLNDFSFAWELLAKELEQNLYEKNISDSIQEITHLIAEKKQRDTEPLTIQCQRIHGDLHLGQLLLNEKKEVVITDFDGEPIRHDDPKNTTHLSPREEDLAGIVRSIDYLVHTASRGRLSTPLKVFIRDKMTRTFLTSYEKSSLNYPVSKLFLENAILRKSLRECQYEWNYRREMLLIPLLGMKAALGQLFH